MTLAPFDWIAFCLCILAAFYVGSIYGERRTLGRIFKASERLLRDVLNEPWGM